MAENPEETRQEQKGEPKAGMDLAALKGRAPVRANGQDGREPAAVDDDWLDWDVKIEIPPPRPTRPVVVCFVEAGRRPIRISEDPQD